MGSLFGPREHVAKVNSLSGKAEQREPEVVTSTTAMSTTAVRGKHRNAAHWRVTDIEWQRIDHTRIRDNLALYYVVTGASFVETAADLYTSNLVEYFPDPVAQHWLINYWQPEELQHGLALRTYVETVWPELDWESGYQQFLAEYSQLCTQEALESSCALEMVARCVIEAGTSTFYNTLQRISDEPVLKTLTGLISQDEVSHYNHFRHFFESYQQQEHIGRLGVVHSLYKRLAEVENEDAYIGLKHAWLMRHPGHVFSDTQYQTISQTLRPLMMEHYPYRMALKMLLRPLALNRTLVKYSMPMLELAARRLMFRTH
jgi:rubrerythrin